MGVNDSNKGPDGPPPDAATSQVTPVPTFDSDYDIPPTGGWKPSEEDRKGMRESPVMDPDASLGGPVEEARGAAWLKEQDQAYVRSLWARTEELRGGRDHDALVIADMGAKIRTLTRDLEEATKELKGIKRSPYCVCGDLDCEHPTYKGCSNYRPIWEWVQMIAGFMKDVPMERIEGSYENCRPRLPKSDA